MRAIKVLYDGWPLVYEPSSPAAIHLLTILESLSEEVEPILAFPADSPEWLSTSATLRIIPTQDIQKARRKWEQSILKRLAKEVDADLIHITGYNPPISPPVPVLISPCGYEDKGDKDFQSRLRIAQGRTGLSQSAGVLWPEDIPVPKAIQNAILLPPTIHPNFISIPFGDQAAPDIPGIELSDTYTLYHGPSSKVILQKLLNSWTWAAGPLGEYYPLLLVGLNVDAADYVNIQLEKLDLATSVRILPQIKPSHLAELYKNCSAAYHPSGVSPWGGAVRMALACGRPLVTFEHPNIDAIAGPSVFTVPKNDTRTFGSAMISTVIKEGIYEPLTEAAIKRARIWRENDIGSRLLEIYHSVI